MYHREVGCENGNKFLGLGEAGCENENEFLDCGILRDCEMTVAVKHI